MLHRFTFASAFVLACAACGSVDPDPAADATAVDAPPTGTAGHIVYTVDDEVFRIEAAPGAVADNLSQRITPQGLRYADRRPSLSSTGVWLVFETGNLDCPTSTCLAVASMTEPGAATLVEPGGAIFDTAESRSAIDGAGTTIVFAAGGGPHARDLYSTHASGSTWSAPTLLTGGSSFEWNDTPSFSPDGDHLVFDCGPVANAGPGGSLCQVAVGGGEVITMMTPDDAPAAVVDRGPLHHASYAGGQLVFEAAWDGERIWTSTAGGAPRLLAEAANNDNSPCVLPDGRIASLYLGRAGNTEGRHELKLMSATGTAETMMVTGLDLGDDGLGCGE